MGGLPSSGCEFLPQQYTLAGEARPMRFERRSARCQVYSLETPSPPERAYLQCGLSGGLQLPGQPPTTGQSVVEARREGWVRGARPIAVRSPRRAESKRPPRYIRVPHFLQPHSKPAEYRSVNSQSPAESRSWLFAAPKIPLTR